MFYGGLNKSLIETLTEISKISNGKYRPAIQIKLLNSISLILTRKPFNFSLGMNVFAGVRRASVENDAINDERLEGGSVSQSFQIEEMDLIIDNFKIDTAVLKKLMNKKTDATLISAATNPEQKTQVVTLALKTLSQYDFLEFSDSITHFVEESVVHYLDDENP
jgi:hypothetical protein